VSIIVQKYGGSSVADVEKIGLVAEKVVAAKRSGHDVVVVVSAMGKTTDQLLALAKGVAKDPPRRELDMLVSTGERVSMALLAIAIQSRGEAAISFTGSQSGIITNDRHFDARIIEVRPHRIEDELHEGRIVIVAGYQGMSYKREITTLGRGGSDTTAVALAAALGAERCEIYSDVDGVYSADPRVVPDAKHLPELDLAMLQELAEAGAKVLNAQAVEWARKAKITLHARKTGDFPVGAGQTAKETIAREAIPTGARAVASMNRIALAECAASALPELLDALAEIELPLYDAAAAGASASVVLPLLNVPDWDKRRTALVRRVGAALSLSDGLAHVSVVGDGLGGRAAQAYRAFGPSLRAFHGGPLRLSGVVAADEEANVVRALHERFCV
jgi:aspartate kinase